MPEAGPKEIRLFCVCGQKMKITADMFGRKCKCIACRQKIRVPYQDEIPEGAAKIYLKDHPEFLRKPYLAAHAAAIAGQKPGEKKDGFESIIIPGDFIKPVMDGDSDDPASRDADPPESAQDGRLIPLDDYQPLRELCSLEYKAGKSRAEDPETGGELKDLEGRLKKSRAKMETKFRERIAETSAELTRIQGELEEYNNELRAGQLNYTDYRSKVRSLRHRREGFARLHHNLRAWLQVRDPYSAGGYVDVPNEALPSAFPLPHPEDAPIPTDIALNGLLQDLHAAFKARAVADKNIDECQRLCDGGVLAGEELDEARATAMAAKARARARILFARGRIAESETDFERDASALHTNLKIAEAALDDSALTERAFKTLKADLERGQRDNEEARDLARRALSANSAEDVPAPHGTFFERLVNTGYVKDLGADRWLGLAAAAALIATAFLPLTPAANNWALLQELCIALIATALLTVALTLIPSKKVRTFAYTALWVLFSVACGFYLHELRFSPDPVGGIVRADAHWWLRPGMASLVLSVALLGAATCLAASSSRRKIPLSPIVGVLLITLGIALTVTHLGGLLTPSVTLGSPQAESVNPLRSAYRVTIPVENTGRRSIWFVQDSASLPFPVSYTLEQDAASTQLLRARALRPEAVQREGGAWTPPEEAIPLHPGGKMSFRFHLSPGQYRFVLASDRVAGMPLEQLFNLERAVPVAVPFRTETSPQEPGEVPAETAQKPTETQPELNQLQVELQGIMSNAEGEPLFMLNVAWPDGAQERWQIRLNQVVFGPWRAQEYNHGDSTLTFSNGEALRILRKKEPLYLSLD